MNLTDNERLKLTATFMNQIAAAIFAIGTFGPLVALLYGVNQNVSSLIILSIGSAVCLLLSFVIHFVGRLILRGLKP